MSCASDRPLPLERAANRLGVSLHLLQTTDTHGSTGLRRGAGDAIADGDLRADPFGREAVAGEREQTLLMFVEHQHRGVAVAEQLIHPFECDRHHRAQIE